MNGTTAWSNFSTLGANICLCSCRLSFLSQFVIAWAKTTLLFMGPNAIPCSSTSMKYFG